GWPAARSPTCARSPASCPYRRPTSPPHLPVLHQEHHVPSHWGATAQPRTATPPLVPRFWHLLSALDPAIPV
ncbi:hypothetical protein, partial [Kitasatospora aureofaciens]|uniref:hypothetical protein n=1 Tax=Kitasatospora aureofaciens TaxID=1894 RepID=UPI00061DB5D7